MPSVRTPVVKLAKTERTHEENRGRAYVAASRRSDRSLGARVESARRASEIHKNRTGRWLKVLEQDVVNGEIYEEEDDDLPMQYRRLTAHLQTSNADSDRRLAAYLANHVVMRTALGQTVNHSQIYPNALQSAGQDSQMTSLLFNTQQNMGSQQSKFTFRQSPYPAPVRGTKHSVRSRLASIVSSNGALDVVDQSTIASRRLLMHVNNGRIEQKPGNTVDLKYQHAENGAASMSSLKRCDSGSAQMTPRPQTQQLKPSELSNPLSASGNFTSAGMGAMPFSTASPVESQQLLGGSSKLNDSLTSMWLESDFNPHQQFFNYDQNADYNRHKLKVTVSPKFNPLTNVNNGMNQTLTCGFLDTSVAGFEINSMLSSAYPEPSPLATSADEFDMNLGGSYSNSFKIFPNDLSSGHNTAANERDWQSMIDGTLWDETSS